MAFVQTSVTEIIKAIELSKRLYECFTDEYDGASNRIRELQDTFNFLSTTFKDYAALLEQCNRTYPGQESLLKKLRELNSFIEKYSAVVPDKSGSNRSTTRRIWQTTRFAFTQHLDRLNDGLKMEMQKLTLSMSQLALNMNVPAVSVQTFQPFASSGNQSSIDAFIRTLRLAKNQYEREMSHAAIHGLTPNIRHIELSVEDAIRRLCYDARLNDSYIPLVSGRELLRSSSQSWNRAVINTANASHDPLRYDPELFQRRGTAASESGVETLPSNASIFSVSTASYPNGSTAQTTPLLHGQIGTEPPRLEPSQFLGNPVLMLGTATILVAGQGKLELQYWSLPDRGARIHWKGAKDGYVIEHWISPDAFPYTKHKTLNEPLSVEFLRSFRIVVKDHGNTKLDCRAKAKYIFSNAEDRDRFQEDVRGKTLIQTFDVSRIKCKSSSALTSNENLTLWRNRQDEQQSSISFFIHNEQQRHLEFSLSWFVPEINADPPNRSVDLEFARPRKGSKTPPAGGRKGSLRKPSFGFSTSPENRSTLSPTSQRFSVTTFSSSESTGDDQAYAPQDCVDKYKHLNIKFSTDQDFSQFTRQFKEAKEADATIFSRPGSIFEHSGGPQELEGHSPRPGPMAELSAYSPGPDSHSPFGTVSEKTGFPFEVDNRYQWPGPAPDRPGVPREPDSRSHLGSMSERPPYSPELGGRSRLGFMGERPPFSPEMDSRSRLGSMGDRPAFPQELDSRTPRYGSVSGQSTFPQELDGRSQRLGSVGDRSAHPQELDGRSQWPGPPPGRPGYPQEMDGRSFWSASVVRRPVVSQELDSRPVKPRPPDPSELYGDRP